MVFNVLLSPQPWKPPSSAMRRLCELQTVRAGILRNRVEWQDRVASGLGDSTATPLAAMTIDHFTTQLEAIDRAICETIDQDAELRSRPTCCSVSRGAVRRWPVCWTEMPEPGLCGAVARSSPMRGSIQAPTGPLPRSTVRRASPKWQCHAPLGALHASAVRDAVQPADPPLATRCVVWVKLI